MGRVTETNGVQCSAHRRDGSQCTRYAIKGGTVCPTHGGSITRVKAKAAARFAEQQAQSEIATFLAQAGVEPVENPLEELRLLAGEIVAVKDWLRTKVEYLSTESQVQGEQISATMQLYSQFVDKADRTLVNIAKLNIDERLARINQTQAQLIAEVLIKALVKLQLDQDTQRKARVVLGEILARQDG